MHYIDVFFNEEFIHVSYKISSSSACWNINRGVRGVGGMFRR